MLQRLLDCGVIAVVRANRGDRLADVAAALLAGGVSAVEITFTVPNALRVLEQVADRLGNQVILGAGTVLDAETARAAVLAGAQFIVTPVVAPKVIRVCRRYSKPAFIGAFTPTEILAAWEQGADVVKVFPSDLSGPGYLKAIAGPLPQIRLMPTGGVTLETAADFLRAGACALGVGSSLVEPHAVRTGNINRIEELAQRFSDIVRQTRRQMAEESQR